jgi:hypothetical protein
LVTAKAADYRIDALFSPAVAQDAREEFASESESQVIEPEMPSIEAEDPQTEGLEPREP